MQAALFGIWTRIAESISYDNTLKTLKIYFLWKCNFHLQGFSAAESGNK